MCHLCSNHNPWFPRIDLDARVWERTQTPVGTETGTESSMHVVKQLSPRATVWFPEHSGVDLLPTRGRLFIH